MTPEQIDEILEYPAFKEYLNEEKIKLRELLIGSKLNIAQMDLLFNQRSPTGGLVCNAVEESKNSTLSKSWLGKIITNAWESPDGIHAPEPIIKSLIKGLGDYTDEIAKDIISLVKMYNKKNNIEIPTPAISPDTKPYKIRLFSDLGPEELLAEKQSFIPKFLEEYPFLNKEWNRSAMVENINYIQGIIRVLLQLKETPPNLLNQENFEKVIEKGAHVAKIALGLEKIKNNLNQQTFDEIIDKGSLSQPEFAKFISGYAKDLKNKQMSSSFDEGIPPPSL